MVSAFESFGPLAQVRPPLFGVCSSGRRFAYSFLQIPPGGGHPCCSAGSSHHRGLRGTFHPQVYEVTTTATSFALTRYAPCLAHRHESLCLQAQASYGATPTVLFLRRFPLNRFARLRRFREVPQLSRPVSPRTAKFRWHNFHCSPPRDDRPTSSRCLRNQTIRFAPGQRRSAFPLLHT
jgi:hypothetical protein